MVTYEAMTPQCGRSVVHVLVVRVDIGVVTYEVMTPQCGRSVVQVLVIRVDIGVVIYEAMTSQCGRSVVPVLVVRVDIGVVTYEAMTSQCWGSVVRVDIIMEVRFPNSVEPRQTFYKLCMYRTIRATIVLFYCFILFPYLSRCMILTGKISCLQSNISHSTCRNQILISC